MRILILSHVLPPAIDGGSSHLHSIGLWLKKQGHQLIFLSSNCSSTDDFVTPKSKNSSSSTYRLPVYKNLYRPLKLANVVLAKGPIFKFIPLLKALKKIIKFKPQLILAGPLPTTITLYAQFLKKLAKSKLIICPCFHPSDPLFSNPVLISNLKSAHLIWTLTSFEKKYLSKLFKIKKQKIFVAGSGINPSLLKNSPAIFPQKPTILYIGSFSAHKNLNTLINSTPKNHHLILAGQKTLYWPKIKQQIKSLPTDTQKCIKTIFNFPKSDLAKIIDSCTCLVLPSSQESFGKVLLEAWARKKPVIVKNTPAPVELVSHSRGGLIFKNNPKTQILKLIKNPKLCRRLGQNGYDFVKKYYTWDKIGIKVWQNISSSL